MLDGATSQWNRSALPSRAIGPAVGSPAAIRSIAARCGRIERAFLATLDGRSPGVDLCIEVAIPNRGGTLEDALAEAERRLAVRTREG